MKLVITTLSLNLLHEVGHSIHTPIQVHEQLISKIWRNLQLNENDWIHISLQRNQNILLKNNITQNMTSIIRKTIISPRWKFEIYPDSNGEYRWHIISSNGKTIGASSEWFSSKAYCIENIKLELFWIIGFLEQQNKIVLPKTIKPSIWKPINIFSNLV